MVAGLNGPRMGHSPPWLRVVCSESEVAAGGELEGLCGADVALEEGGESVVAGLGGDAPSGELLERPGLLEGSVDDDRAALTSVD